MEDVIGIKVRDSNNRWFGFMSYPEICIAIEANGEDLLTVIKPFLRTLEGMAEPQELVVLPSIRGVQTARHFYQGLFKFCWNTRPVGKKYETWRARILKEFRKVGAWMYFLGPFE